MLKKNTSVWNDVLVSILSTYSISVEKVDGMSAAFAKVGLSEPDRLAKMSYEEVYDALCAAGYNRGKLMGIFVPRVVALGQYVQDFGVAKAEKILMGHDKEAIQAILLPIKGMGPKAVEIFMMLRGFDDK